MKPRVAIHRPAGPSAVRCLVAAYAVCRVALDQLPGLRSNPGPLQGQSLPASFLKHSDEQTVAGIVALSQAIQQDDTLAQRDFTHWGVIAAPRFLGRAALAIALTRFAAEGAWGISPHLIPHRSLHAMSGTVSQALRIHGPNFGVGGGTEAASEALLVASALLADRELPGVWVVLTGFDPELVPADPLDAGSAPPVAECVATALALVPARPDQHGTFLTVGVNGADGAEAEWPLFGLEALAAAFSAGSGCARWQLRCGGWAVWEYAEAAVETCL